MRSEIRVNASVALEGVEVMPTHLSMPGTFGLVCVPEDGLPFTILADEASLRRLVEVGSSLLPQAVAS